MCLLDVGVCHVNGFVFILVSTCKCKIVDKYNIIMLHTWYAHYNIFWQLSLQIITDLLSSVFVLTQTKNLKKYLSLYVDIF